MRDSARSTSGRVAARPDSSYGNASTYCRTRTARSTQSTRCAAVPAMRRPAQLGHRPRNLQEKATALSSWHAGHWTWTTPREKSPHSRYFRNSSFRYFGRSERLRAQGHSQAGIAVSTAGGVCLLQVPMAVIPAGNEVPQAFAHASFRGIGQALTQFRNAAHPVSAAHACS